MNLFKKEKPPFIDNIAEHTGEYIGLRGRLKCWKLRDPTIEPFDSITQRVCAELERCRFPRSSVVIFKFYICGVELLQAAVYVVLLGASKTYRKRAVRYLKKTCLPKDYHGLKFDHWEWAPASPVSQIVMKGLSDWPRPPAQLIYATSGYRVWYDELTKVLTIGSSDLSLSHQSGVISGMLCVTEGKVHILAPAHIFMARHDEEDLLLHDSGAEMSADTDSESASGNGSQEVNPDNDHGLNMLRAGSATPPESQVSRSHSPSVGEATTSGSSSRDKATEAPEMNWELSKADQSSSADFDTEVPFAEAVSRELDYAIIPLAMDIYLDIFKSKTHHNFTEENTIAIEPGYSKEAKSVVATVVLPSFPCPVTGTISIRPTMMRLPFSGRFRPLYAMDLAVPMQKGESGSIVSDPFSGKIYGIVVAGSMEGKVVYIIPAVNVLDDIKARKGRIIEIHDTTTNQKKEPVLGFAPPSSVHGTAWPSERNYVDEPSLPQYDEPLSPATTAFPEPRATKEPNEWRVEITDMPSLELERELRDHSTVRNIDIRFWPEALPWQAFDRALNATLTYPNLLDAVADIQSLWDLFSSKLPQNPTSGNGLQELPPSPAPSSSSSSSTKGGHSNALPGFPSANTWNESEKRFLLAEVIKASKVDIKVLIKLLVHHDISPNWFMMEIPRGRTMQACIGVLQDLVGPEKVQTEVAGQRAREAVNAEATHIIITNSAPKTIRIKWSDLSKLSSDETKRFERVDALARSSKKRKFYHDPAFIAPGPTASEWNAIAPVAIAPRPTAPRSGTLSPLLESSLYHVPKKRGRPTRAQKASRDLRPLLPSHIVPRSPLVSSATSPAKTEHTFQAQSIGSPDEREISSSPDPPFQLDSTRTPESFVTQSSVAPSVQHDASQRPY